MKNIPEVRRILIVTGYKEDLLSDYISQLNHLFPCELLCVAAPNYKQGNGHSLLALESDITEHFFLAMSDHLFEDRFYQKIRTGVKKKGDLSLCIDAEPDPSIQLDDATKVLLDQRNSITRIGKNLLTWSALDTGLFFLSPLIFKRLKQVSKKYLTLTDGVTEMIRCGDDVKGTDVSGLTWADIDTFMDLQQAKARFLDYVTPGLSDQEARTVSLNKTHLTSSYLETLDGFQLGDA
jgi:choline kinase